MTQLNVAITEEQDAFVTNEIARGEYADAGEVLRDALRALEQEKESAAKLEALNKAIEDGIASGVYEGDPFADVRREMGWETGV